MSEKQSSKHPGARGDTCPACGIRGKSVAENGNIWKCSFGPCSVMEFRGRRYGNV